MTEEYDNYIENGYGEIEDEISSETESANRNQCISELIAEEVPV